MKTETHMKLYLALTLLSVALLPALGEPVSPTNATPVASVTNASAKIIKTKMNEQIPKTEEEWKKILTPEQYRVLREKGTERAFTGAFWNTKDKGSYQCAGCGEVLFRSETKFDSGCGWPSFYAPSSTNLVAETEDRSHSMIRTEVTCSKCGGHLGHVFNDGPKPTGLRYCINSASLKFEPVKKEEKKK